MIHQLLSSDGVHPKISSSLRLLVLCLVRSDLFVIQYCLFILFKELISFIGFLDKYHTSVFNALIFVYLPYGLLNRSKSDLNSKKKNSCMSEDKRYYGHAGRSSKDTTGSDKQVYVCICKKTVLSPREMVL